MTLAVLGAKRGNSIIVIDLYSGKRALIYAQWIGYICRTRKIQYFVVLHGGNLPEVLKNEPYKLENLLINSTRIVAPSAYMATKFSKFPNVQTIPNAINVNDYLYISRERVYPRILFLRSFHKLTRPKDAIYCLQKLLESFPNIRMTMAGGDEDGTLGECINIIADLHLEKNIDIVGKLSKQQIYQLSNNHDIFLHTMQIDNMPITLLEAMALGLCIVATDVGGIPYIFENNKTAQLVNVGDVNGMANAIKKYLLETEYAHDIRNNAREEVKKYSWERVIPYWLHLLRK